MGLFNEFLENVATELHFMDGCYDTYVNDVESLVTGQFVDGKHGHAGALVALSLADGWAVQVVSKPQEGTDSWLVSIRFLHAST
jgi:hypothetical protein